MKAFLSRLWLAALLVVSPTVVRNRYEAGERWSTRRSHLRGFVQDARFDADQMTRLEIVRKSRYFERNNAILNRLADLFEQYTVGPSGLQFVPASSDEDWNRRTKAWWQEWCNLCDLTSRQTFGTIQSLAARAWLVDGEVFILKTSGRARRRMQDGREIEISYPRIQLIESHRVETPPDQQTSDRIIDGVQIDERGRPVGYWVRQSVFHGGPFSFASDSFEFVPAEDMIHIFEPSRPGMYRGLPFAYPVMNDLHDLDDLQVLEMDAAKEAAKTEKVIKTKTGELPMEDHVRNRILRGGANNTQGTSGGSSNKRDTYYQDVFGAGVKVLKHDDEFNQYASQRPSVAVQAYWEHLISKICAGIGISKLLVFPHSMQGTVTRADLDVANAFFRSRSSVLAGYFTQVWLYVIEWATRNVLELSDPPEDWRKVNVRAPRSVIADVGRNSNALIAEYEAGWRTLDGICGELGEDWRDVLRQRAVERAAAREIEQEYGLEPGELIKAALEALKQAKQAVAPPPAEPQPQPEPVAA